MRVIDPWEELPTYVDEVVARAMAHPVRVQILAQLNKRVMSPSRFAERFGLELTTVSYHFRLLKKANLIEVVYEVPRRNAVEHFYRATKRALFDTKAWEDLPETIRNLLSAQTVGDLLETVAEAMLAETFDARLDRRLGWQRETVDEQGWEEASAICRETMERLMEVAKESRARLLRSGEKGLAATWALLLFESPFEEPESPGEF